MHCGFRCDEAMCVRSSEQSLTCVSICDSLCASHRDGQCSCWDVLRDLAPCEIWCIVVCVICVCVCEERHTIVFALSV